VVDEPIGQLVYMATAELALWGKIWWPIKIQAPFHGYMLMKPLWPILKQDLIMHPDILYNPPCVNSHDDLYKNISIHWILPWVMKLHGNDLNSCWAKTRYWPISPLEKSIKYLPYLVSQIDLTFLIFFLSFLLIVFPLCWFGYFFL
jgi:hypothetical protein